MTIRRNKQSGFTIKEVIGALVLLTFFGGMFLGAYVLAHFIIKFW